MNFQQINSTCTWNYINKKNAKTQWWKKIARVWYKKRDNLDLQLPMHQCPSPLTLWVGTPLRRVVLDTTYVIKLIVSDLWQVSGFLHSGFLRSIQIYLSGLHTLSYLWRIITEIKMPSLKIQRIQSSVINTIKNVHKIESSLII